MSQESLSKNQRRFASRLGHEVKEHERKLLNAHVSVQSRVGKLAIIVSNRVFKYGEYDARTQREAFHDEADEIAELRSGCYGGIEIRRAAKAPEIARDLGDKEVSDMIFIGHGSISGIWLDTGQTLRWRNVAKHTRYLKQGRIEQRMCGHFSDYDSVPMGTFALLDQRGLIAPVGAEIDDVDPDETLFRPVYEKSLNTAKDILALIRSFDDQPPVDTADQSA